MLLSPHVTLISMYLPLDKFNADALIASGLTLPDRLRDAHPMRKEKYLAGRLCAHLALIEAGEKVPREILMATDGSPIWPSGWTGSITHSEGYAAAAVGKLGQIKSLGIDSEPLMNSKTFENVAGRILCGREVHELCPENWNELEWVTLVFSAKESIYKCLRPLCGNFFGFEDAEMDEVDEVKGRLKFHLNQNIGGTFNQGWQGEVTFEKKAGWFHTALVLQS